MPRFGDRSSLRRGPEGTKITLIHTDIPDGQGEGYRKGWIDLLLYADETILPGKVNGTNGNQQGLTDA